MSAFLGARIRTRCIRSERSDISVKRSRGTSSEFHSDRMRTGHFLRIPAVPGNNKNTTTHLFGVSRASKDFFLNISIQEILDSLKMYTESL